MNKIYKLHNQFKHYEWGSPDLIPQFLDIRNKSTGSILPYAEMWMGTHSGAPSQIETNPAEKQSLSEIAGELPFLFKLIAVEKQLSIQVHPTKEQAEKGFEREEMSGLPVKAPTRNYKDINHKPEIICAISPFSLMAGFRECKNIYESFEELASNLPQLKEMIRLLLKPLEKGLLTVFFRILYSFSKLERDYICKLISEKEDVIGEKISSGQWDMMKKFSRLYPAGASVLSPLYLNLLTLSPGQAIYVPAGVLHSYTSGFGVELMAASDNVLRGGLTPKYIDIPQFISILDFNPYLPAVLTPGDSPWFSYQTPCKEFSLTLMRSSGEENVFLGKESICLVTEGELNVSCSKTDSFTFKKGESFFIPAEKIEQPLSFSGNYSLFAAAAGSVS